MQEQIDINQKLGEIVAKYPKTRKVFEKFDIDYCCGGEKTIKAASEEKDIDVDNLIKDLEFVISESADQEKSEEKIWINESLTDIINHIVSDHHAFLRKELPYTFILLDKVVMVHGPKHGDVLNFLNDKFLGLKEKLERHLDDEEIILFPFVKALEAQKKEEVQGHDGENFQKIIEILYSEHEEAGEALREMRRVTSNYTLPVDACESFKTLYENIQAIEDDLHKHIHLENTVLFPRIKKLLNI